MSLALQYFARKGLFKDTLSDFEVLWLEEGTPKSYIQPKWTSFGDQFLQWKIGAYKAENVLDAAFIPIYNLYKEPIGVQIRRFADERKHDGSKFNKGQMLFNLNQAYPHILKEDRVFITEGVFDTMGLHGAGFKNSVALLGTNMTEIQLCLLLRFTKNIVLVLDPDDAGQKNIEKILNTYGRYANFSVSSVDKDPDEFLLEKGKEAFVNTILSFDDKLKLQLRGNE